jgi:hypothetical protein
MRQCVGCRGCLYQIKNLSYVFNEKSGINVSMLFNYGINYFKVQNGERTLTIDDTVYLPIDAKLS